jgi:hypothetical protein
MVVAALLAGRAAQLASDLKRGNHKNAPGVQKLSVRPPITSKGYVATGAAKRRGAPLVARALLGRRAALQAAMASAPRSASSGSCGYYDGRSGLG